MTYYGHIGLQQLYQIQFKNQPSIYGDTLESKPGEKDQVKNIPVEIY